MCIGGFGGASAIHPATLVEMMDLAVNGSGCEDGKCAGGVAKAAQEKEGRVAKAAPKIGEFDQGSRIVITCWKCDQGSNPDRRLLKRPILEFSSIKFIKK